MEMIFMAVDRASQNVIFEYPCRTHQLSFKGTDAADIIEQVQEEGLKEGDRVGVSVYLENLSEGAKAEQAKAVGTPLTAWEKFEFGVLPGLTEGTIYAFAGYGFFHVVKFFVTGHA